MFQARKSKIYHGLRLMDYMRNPHNRNKFRKLPKASHLLQARVGQRYFNQQQSDLEKATIIASQINMATKRGKVHTFRRLKSLLSRSKECDLDDEMELVKNSGSGRLPETSFLGSILKRNRLEVSNLHAFVACFEADTMASALASMHGQIWPPFLVLFTLQRKCTKLKEAYEALRLYRLYISSFPRQFQVELVSHAIDIAQSHLVEVLPAVCEIFVKNAAKDVLAEPAVLNELLWRIARFGTQWRDSDRVLITEAQRVLVHEFGQDLIDAKGYAAIAYTLYMDNPKAARALVDSCESRPGDFAYAHGRSAIYLLTCTSAEEVIARLQTLGDECVPFLWSLGLRALLNMGKLDKQLALKIWRHFMSKNLRFNDLFVECIISAMPTLADKQIILQGAVARGIRPTSRVTANLARTENIRELADVYDAVRGSRDPLVLGALMDTQAKLDPQAVWATYAELLKVSDPDVNAFTSLLRAAWQTTIVWDGLFAAQRALDEAKRWLRGLDGDGGDVLQLFPTQGLMYSYIVLLGKARYSDELHEILPWMNKIGFKPSKQVLCALIHHSPDREALIRLGVRMGAAEWPSQAEFEQYERQYP